MTWEKQVIKKLCSYADMPQLWIRHRVILKSNAHAACRWVAPSPFLFLCEGNRRWNRNEKARIRKRRAAHVIHFAMTLQSNQSCGNIAHMQLTQKNKGLFLKQWNYHIHRVCQSSRHQHNYNSKFCKHLLVKTHRRSVNRHRDLLLTRDDFNGQELWCALLK